MAGTFALLAWELARRLTGSGRVAVVATLLVIFGGGMGWIRLPMDVAAGQGSPLDLIARNSYDCETGRRAGRTSGSPRSWGRASSPTGPRPSACRGW